MEVGGIMRDSQIRYVIDPNKYKDWPQVAEKLERLNAFLNKAPLLGPDEKERAKTLALETIAMLNQERKPQEDVIIKRSIVPSVILGCSFVSFLVFAIGYGLSKPPNNSFFLHGSVASFVIGLISDFIMVVHSRKALLQTIKIDELITDIRKACEAHLQEPTGSGGSSRI